MNIGDVARQSGLPPKTIRYYEDISLVKPQREANGYRVYSDADLHKLTFLCRSRALGFTIEDCRTLLALYEDKSRASAEVKTVTRKHLDEIEAKINDLQAMHATLSRLSEACAGDLRPDCPILEELSGQHHYLDAHNTER